MRDGDGIFHHTEVSQRVPEGYEITGSWRFPGRVVQRDTITAECDKDSRRSRESRDTGRSKQTR